MDCRIYFFAIACLMGAAEGTAFAQMGEAPRQVAYGYSSPQPGLESGGYDLTDVYSRAGATFAEDERAYTELNLTVIRLQREFHASGEYQAAIAELDSAAAGLDAARQPVLDAIGGDAHYRELAARKTNVALVLQDGNLSARDVLDLAARKMQYSSEMHRMEADALGRDWSVQAARQRLLAAQHNLDGSRERFEIGLYKNLQWATAKLAYDNAEIAFAGAEGAVAGASVTACLASAADARRSLYNYEFGNGTYVNGGYGAGGYGGAVVDASTYYGRRY